MTFLIGVVNCILIAELKCKTSAFNKYQETQLNTVHDERSESLEITIETFSSDEGKKNVKFLKLIHLMFMACVFEDSKRFLSGPYN